jgi:hypothetical protein
LYSNQAFESGIEALKNFVGNRRAYLLNNRGFGLPVPEIVAVHQAATVDDDGETLTVTATLGDAVAVSNVQLFVAPGPFAVFTPVPMADDGQHGDGAASDRTYGAVLSDHRSGTVLRYYVQAVADDASRATTFSPSGAEHDVYSHVVTCSQAAYSRIVINEFMARNDSVLADPQGEYDDWIELKNVSDQIVDLAGMYLSDNPDNPLKWKFPEDTVLEPGGYLIVWADEDGGDEGLHCNFRLAGDGETIWLLDTIEAGHALLDSVTYADLDVDVSLGRLPDGEGPAQVLTAASPRGPND